MRVAQICPLYYPSVGGIVSHVREISKRLSQKGIDVEILTTDPHGKLATEELIDGIYVKRFRSYAPDGAYFFSSSLKNYLNANLCNYDVVHAHDYHALPALYASQTKNIHRFIFTPHYHERTSSSMRNILHVFYRYYGKQIFEKANAIISVSKYERNLILKRFTLRDVKLHLIPNGIDFTEYQNIIKETHHRKILCVSRLKKYKGIEYLIKAVARLDEDTRLDIIGAGDYEQTLAKLVTNLKISNKVNFFKNLPRNLLLEKYALADVFVLLSTQEAFGMSVAEALASGVPCIVANSSALSDWVDNKNCYGLNYPIDIKELAQLIDQVIGKRVEKPSLLSWDEVTERLMKLYNYSTEN
jgi:glycosyltransferase involved in cell wall biosynthesis